MKVTDSSKIIKIIAKTCEKKCSSQCDADACSNQECGTKVFFVKSKESFPEFVRLLCRFLEKLHGNFEIDVESFVKEMSHVNREQLLSGIIFAVHYAECVPYNKKTIAKKTPPKITLSEKVDAKMQQEIENLTSVINEVRRLQDTPSDLLFPTSFVDEIKKIAGNNEKIEYQIFDKAELTKMGMNLLLGVNKGSNKEPRLLVMKYLANPDSDEIYGLVGKGITFDSGGMNIKTQSHMSTMKFDMSGAAIACGTLIAVAKNNIKANVIAVASLTENSIGPNALRPDDILTSYDGKTVQIDNTDAEGRLVLADAISYLSKNYKVTRIYDIATLTGAIGICFGDIFTGVWSTDDLIWKDFKNASEIAGELVWRMPFHSEYRKVLDTQIADMSNISCRSFYAGSSVAAAFLSEFRGSVPLVHLDIAYTAVSPEKTGTGVMVRTLYQVCKHQK